MTLEENVTFGELEPGDLLVFPQDVFGSAISFSLVVSNIHIEHERCMITYLENDELKTFAHYTCSHCWYRQMLQRDQR